MPEPIDTPANPEPRDGAPEPKRTDVGYKRPPPEHRFKKGQAPPPRKKKGETAISMRDIFWKVLQERRRVRTNGKVAWFTNAELIARRAFQEAEQGSAVLRRLIDQLVIVEDGASEEQGPELKVMSNAEAGDYAILNVWVEEPPPK